MKLPLFLLTNLFFLLNLYCFNTYGAERVVIVNKSVVDLITSAQERFSHEKAFDLDLDELPKALFNVDTEITTYARPKHHYYCFNARLLEPVNKLNYVNKTLEIWGQGDQTTLRSTITINYGNEHIFPFRWVDKIKGKVISKIEEALLDFEFLQILGE